MAGDVKARGDRRRARSDWMKIEQERGISVTSSVMMFEKDNIVFNLLDTPGHEDFSEDTYRTLSAVDSAIMVIDAAKGIEIQTRKLFEVCRLREIPIMTFVNKLDRAGREPFELLDELQNDLALDMSPQVWPIGMGTDFHGCYDMANNLFYTVSEDGGAGFGRTVKCSGIEDTQMDILVKAPVLSIVREEIELAQAGYPRFDHKAFLDGNLSPVIFGSALRGFGVGALLDIIAKYAPSPRSASTQKRDVLPCESKVSGFIFKVQANMDSNHRDRIAFMRICSGHFKRGMKLRQVRAGKDMLMHSPIFFMARDRQIADNAEPGDIIGIPNHGTVRVGDTFTQGEELRFTGLPVFAPEHLRRIVLTDATRSKQLRKALEDLAEEGLIQVFRPSAGAHWIIGVVGTLQLDVMTARAKQEYKINIRIENLPYTIAVWLKSDNKAALDNFIKYHGAEVVRDRYDNPVFLARNAWELDYKIQKNEEIKFLKTREL